MVVVPEFIKSGDNNEWLDEEIKKNCLIKNLKKNLTRKTTKIVKEKVIKLRMLST